MQKGTILRVAGISAAVFVVLAGGVLGGMWWYGRSMSEDRCLAHRINAQWSRSGHLETTSTGWFGFGRERPRNPVALRESLAQAEMIARIEKNILEDQGKTSFCPPDWGQWGWLEFKSRLRKADEKRWEIVSRYARNARNNSYEFTPPAGLTCKPIAYKATKLRLSPRIRDSELRIAAKIGTMTIYCKS